MRFAVARRAGSAVWALLLSIGISLAVVSALYAQSDTTVTTNVCGLSQTANIVITSPLSNTSTSMKQVTVMGTLTQVTQLTAYIDGQFSEVIPIDSDATTFTYSYLSPVGQHTLRLEGQDLCQRTTPVAELVLTYDPTLPPTPITGPSAPAATSSPMAASTPATASQAATEEVNNLGGASIVLPDVLRLMGDGVGRVLTGLDITSGGREQSIVAAMRFALVTSGTMAIIFAGGVLKLSASLLPLAVKRGLIVAVPSLLVDHPRFVISLIGLILVIIGFLLPN